MNYLEEAVKRIPHAPLLINVVSRRTRQLIAGQRPLVKPDYVSMSPADIALKEIAEGKMTVEWAFTEGDTEEEAGEPTPKIL